VLFVVGMFVIGMSLYLIFLFSMIFAMASWGGPEVDYAKVERDGNITSGMITDMTTEYTISIGGEHPTTIYYIYAADGDTLDSQVRVLESGITDDFAVGDEVEVKYLGSESMISGIKPFTFPFRIILYVAGSFAVAGALLVLFAVISTLAKASLLKHGKVVEASLVSINRKSPFANAGTVVYQYDTIRGVKVTGSSKTKDLMFLLDKKPGDTIKIFVGKNNENKSCLIPAAEIERNRWVL
jgi:hypothetical protein